MCRRGSHHRVSTISPHTVLLVVAIGLAVAGCANAGDSAAERERAASLAGSAEMTAREWLLGAVPTHFAERALVNTFELLSDSLEQMRADAEGGDSEAKAMLDPLMSLALAVGQLG